MVRYAWPGWWLGLLVGAGSPGGGASERCPAENRAEGELPQSVFPGDDDSVRNFLGGMREGSSAGSQSEDLQRAGAGRRHSDPGQWLERERLDSLRLRCGEHRAYWDGKYLDGKREAITGVYYYQLTVDGERFTRKMIAQKKTVTER